MGIKELKVLTPKICEMVAAGKTKTEIAKHFKVSPASMHRFFKELERNGVIERQFKSSFVKYKVKQNFIFNVGRVKSKSCVKFFRLHHLGFKFPIIKDSKLPYDKVLNLRGGKQFIWKNKQFGWSVRKTPKSVVVWLNKPLFGVNPGLLRKQGFKEIDAVRVYLESKFGFVFGDGLQVGKEHYAVEDEFAAKFHLAGKTFSNSLIDFDDSVKQDGELDLKDVELADDYSLMPGRVAKLEKGFDFLVESFDLYNKNIALHLEVLRDIKNAIVELRGVLNGKC